MPEVLGANGGVSRKQHPEEVGGDLAGRSRGAGKRARDYPLMAWLFRHRLAASADTCGNPQVGPVEIHSRQAVLFTVH